MTSETFPYPLISMKQVPISSSLKRTYKTYQRSTKGNFKLASSNSSVATHSFHHGRRTGFEICGRDKQPTKIANAGEATLLDFDFVHMYR